MRTLDEIESALERKGFKIYTKSLDGFAAGNQKKKTTIIASWGGGWEHVSINAPKTPTWEQMCSLKDMFWGEDETVVQYHPAKADYVNNLEHCLHLWKPIAEYVGELPKPPAIMVGIK